LASGSGDNIIRIWDLKTNSVLSTLKGHTKSVNSVSFSPDGKKLVSGSGDNTIKIWDLKIISVEATLKGHASGI
jgi:WD40 repeat protein